MVNLAGLDKDSTCCQQTLSRSPAVGKDAGEASAFALSFEYNSSLLIIDDLKARRLAEKLSLNYTGTLGIFLKAKELNLFPSVKPLLYKIQLTNFRFSQKVYDEILVIANEK